MNTTIVRLPEVIAKTGRSRSTIYFQISNGDFPRGIPIGQHARGWLNHEIEEWIERKVALRGIKNEC